MRTWNAVLIAAAALLPSAGLAQFPARPQLAPGTEVRVMRSQAGGHRAQLLRGRLQRRMGDTIVVAESFDRQTTRVLGEADELETRVGRKSDVRRAAATGLAGASLFGLGGMAVGALIGANSGTETWAPAPASRLSFEVTPAPGGARLAVGIAF